jgi:hypothetical protein
MLKFKKYRVRCFAPSPVPVRVLDKFPHSSVADPGCFIPNFFIPDPDPGSRG